MQRIPHPSDHDERLQRALADEVDRLEPCDCLPQILAAAHRPAWWAIALTATVGALLLLLGLLMLLRAGQSEPAPSPVPPSTRLLEA
ncbi:hypothetical protein AB0L05_27895 [Nonomuraea pusilla]|uniref:hypothetical protein n=1 Tax=Nonomuraea pusilla TaxID=46177 RepID=UPI00332390F2